MAGSSRIDELRKKFDENPRRYFAPLANEYRKLGDFDQAIFICQEFLPQQPGHMSGHIVYGQALFEGGRHEEARTVFETALTLDPENLIALRHLGDIARAFGDLVSARGWYQRVLDADPRNEEIAAILESLGGPPPAAEASVANQGTAATAASAPDAQSESNSLGEVRVESATFNAPPKSSVSDFAALIEEVRAEAAGESAPARETPAPSSSADAHALPALEGLQGAFTEAPPAASTSAKIEPDLDALFDVPSAPGDSGVEKTSDPTSGLRGSAPSAEPLGDLVIDGAATASSAATAAGAFVTETMAELYLRQGHREEALGVYRQLVEARPGDEGLRGRLSELEAESSTGQSSPAEAPPPAESPRRQLSGKSIREFLGDIAARRPRTNGSPASDAAPEPSAVAGNELPYLTDVPAPSPTSASASAEPTSPSLPDLSAEVAGMSYTSMPAASGRVDRERDSEASLAGSLGALFAGAEAPGGNAGSSGGSKLDDRSDAPDESGQRSASARDSATGEHAPLPGRPTQPAATELSLDYVFRHVTPAKGTPGQPNFSFDQFFSQESQKDAATSGGEPAREPTTGESDDIQQFNAWLEGLKKS